MFAGRKATFIRLAGCNLDCPWCDTKDKMNGFYHTLTIAGIVQQIPKDVSSVVITGGEPTIHSEEKLVGLARMIHRCSSGMFVSLETNGTNRTPAGIWITCSPKPPNYTIHEHCRYDELKYVVDDVFDVSVIPRSVWHSPHPIIVQPESMKPESMKKCYDLVMRYPRLRLGVQLHKVLGVE